MIVIENLQSDLKKLPRKHLVMAVGNFDGLHLGHQAVIGRAVDIARQSEYAAAVLTFRQHPRSVLHPHDPPLLLLPPGEKIRRIEQLGADLLIHLDFTAELARLSAEEFIAHILCEQLNVSQIVVGHNFHFGKDRRGSPELLQKKGTELGFEVTIIPPVKIGDQIVSSTTIRHLLRQGQVEQASVFLNREYEVVGKVVSGEGRGRGLGFPTANLEVENELIPRCGVYAVWVVHQGKRFPGMLNIGRRPTFAGRSETIEVHLIGFEGDLRGQSLNIYFAARVRDEQSFATAEALQQQLAQDRGQVLAMLSRSGNQDRPTPKAEERKTESR